ncbi:hypothetical protein [Gulosibacter chungangensis]|uniref:Peptidylprolyl isomerase n=1 Tax=Gulosibacter chungangensis TaxID=979746 RepID=A0A7J5BFK0_9MICO|nr:hypothetical protein [Gulosibacter chungangensis]KAB1644153.1 hypothetical protein F8O05_05080 [Gulosibacter chungangensis]
MTATAIRKSALAGLGIVSILALSACAQVPASDQVSACEPTTNFQVERSGEGDGQVITEGAITAFDLTVAFEDGTEIIPQTAVVDMGDGTASPANLNYLSAFPLAAFGGMSVDLSSVGEALRCAQAGQQVNATMRVDQFFPEELSASMGDDLNSQNVIVTANIDSVYHSAATGRINPQQNGIPAVVSAPDGTPGVTMPQESAPTEQRVGVTINGFGAPVTEGQKLTLHLSAFTWTDSTQILTTWGNAGPALQLLAGAGDGFYDISTELIGKSVGSQVVIVLPASTIAADTESDFGSDLGSGDAVVFVIDILGAE